MSASPPRPPDTPDPDVGLCGSCRHARVQRTGRGSTFWRCGLADTRVGVRKYPPLPVLACDLHESGTPEGSTGPEAGAETGMR